MTFGKISTKLMTGAYEPKVPFPCSKQVYPDTYVFDEGRTVRWNKEKVKEENQKREEALAEYRASVREGENAFRTDAISLAMDEYGLNEAQAQMVFSTAYEHGHSAGFSDVLYYVEVFGELAGKILAAQDKEGKE